jgi:TM2 domain-containing membrane protein YozV
MAEKQVIIVRQEKSMAAAYVLLIFLGQFGIHRFYAGKVGTAITQLLLGVVGWGTTWAVVGFIPLTVLWVWLFVDLFLTAGLVRKANNEIRKAV